MPPESFSITKAPQLPLLPTTLPSQEPPAIQQDCIPCSTTTEHQLQLSTNLLAYPCFGSPKYSAALNTKM